MLLSLGVYGIAAVSDARTRRVPNVLWAVALLSFIWRGTPLTAALPALVVGSAAVVAWYAGEIGGADVKGLALLPVALPTAWPIALVAMGVITAIAFVGLGRDEVPLFVPIFAGVVLSVAGGASPYLYT